MQENKSGGTNTFNYHPELIALYNSGVLLGVIVGNIMLGIIFIVINNKYIPTDIMILWGIYNLLVSLFRVVITKTLKTYATDVLIANKLVNLITLSIALNGTIWGVASILTFLYSPAENLSFIAILIIGIMAGAMASVSPIFKAYVVYVIFAFIPLSIVLFLSDTDTLIATGVLSVLLGIFVFVGGIKHYKKLREAILLKDELKILNEDLEGVVKKRTFELEVLNNSLEDKVQDEIAKNRDKDQKLVQQSRMAQMGEMISMIAHQWRQPLGAIAASSIDLKMKIAFASFDLDKKEEQEECTAYFDEQLSNIETYVQGLTTTIDDFRNFYKPNKEKKRMTINEPIEKSLSIIEAVAKASGVEIIKDFKSMKMCEFYDSELMQVFLNIIKNAQDNFKEKEISNARIMITTMDIPEGVKVEICDNGGGIPEDIIKKIFDPYFSTKDEKNGTGLGLYMSKTIVEEHHDGILEVCNKEDGVCFVITIKTEAEDG